MLRLLPILLFSLVLGACAGSENPGNTFVPDTKNEALIVGGQEVSSDDLNSRAVVLIYGEKPSGESFVCTGSFISETTILTAAHCATEETNTMSLFYGQKLFATQEKSLKVTGVKIHKRYHPKALQDRNDIALIYFSGGLPAGAKIASIKNFPLATVRLFNLESYGYGMTQGKDDATEDFSNLRKVSLRGLSWNQLAPGFLKLRQDQGRGVCFGDSGGPVFMGSSIVAIASGVRSMNDQSDSDACAESSFFTRLDTYKPWIKEFLNPPVR